eukprot:TRINITY_DN8321_c0_g1_i1.p1 TRINITY_DN8321_c0_g1~~TRINITY_DN8321_c0_g1_i1.p1  ORF type:complete len:277 (-),score=36.15 TRINITY_DN8321_c0_g1_i1:504-1334(-)
MVAGGNLRLENGIVGYYGYPGIQCLSSATISVDAGAIHVGAKMFLYLSSCSLSLTSGNIEVDNGLISVSTFSSFRIEGGNVLLRRDTCFSVEDGAQLSTANGNVLVTDSSCLQLHSYSRWVISGGSVMLRGDDLVNPASEYFPGVIVTTSSRVTLSGGEISSSGLMHFDFCFNASLSLTGGNINFNGGQISFVYNSSGEIDGGSLYITNGSSMLVSLRGRLDIRGGGVELSAGSQIRIEDSSFVSIACDVTLTNSSSITRSMFGSRPSSAEVLAPL